MIVGLMMTQINNGGRNIMSALTKLGWQYQRLGENKQWTGWVMRMKEYRDFAASRPPMDLIIFIDAYDALPIRTPDNFEEVFNSFQKDIVLGAERYCIVSVCRPVKGIWSTTSKNAFIQGGCVVGRAHALAKMYQWCIDSGYTDDQIAMSHYCTFLQTARLRNITIDIDNKIAYHDNWGRNGTYLFKEKITVERDDGLVTEPYFVHFPDFQSGFFGNVDHYNLIGKQILDSQFIEMSTPASQWPIAITTTVVILFVLFIILYTINQKL